MNNKNREKYIKEDILRDIDNEKQDLKIQDDQAMVRRRRKDFVASLTYKFSSVFTNYPFLCFGIGFSIHLSFLLLTFFLHFMDLAEVLSFTFDDLPLIDNKYEPYHCFKAVRMLYLYKFQLGYDMSLFIRYPFKISKNLFRIYYDASSNENMFTGERLLKMKEFELKLLSYFQKIKKCYLTDRGCREIHSVVDILLEVNPNDIEFMSYDNSVSYIMSRGDLKLKFIPMVSNDFTKRNSTYKAKAFKTDINIKELTVVEINEVIIMFEKYFYEYKEYFYLYYEHSRMLPAILYDQIKKDGKFIPGCLILIFLFTWFQTKSLFVTSLGIVSIITSFFCANLMHTVVLGIKYFGFFHVLSIFLILGLGCDNIYVFFDRWKSFHNTDTDDLAMRLTNTFLGVGWSMFITSITTAMAFCILIWTPLVTISTFGLFVSLLVMINYISVVLYLPSVIIIYHLRFEDKTHSQESFLWLANFFSIHFFAFLKKTFVKYSILSLFAFVAVASVVFISRIKISEEFPHLLLSTTFYGEMVQLKENYFAKSQVDENLQVLILTGLKGLDFSGCLFWDFKCTPKLIFDDNFIMTDSNNQEQFQEICTDLIHSDQMTREYLALFNDTINQILCLPLDMNSYFMKEFPNSSFLIPWTGYKFLDLLHRNEYIYGTDIPDESFPYKFETAMYFFLSGGYSFENAKKYNSYRYTLYFKRTNYSRYFFNEVSYGHKINYTAILVNITLFKIMSGFTEKKKVFDNWIKWVNNKRKSTNFYLMVCGSQLDISLNGYFHWVHVQQSLTEAAIRGIILGLVVAIPILLCATQNVYSFLIILLGTVLSTMTVISIIGLFGWDFGLTESIVISIVVGLTIDYLVHMGLAYNNCNLPTKEAKTQHILKEMGVSILSGMITTLGSAVFLFFCKVTFLFEFGIFAFVTIASAGIYSLLFLPCFFLAFGPVHTQGSFAHYTQMLFNIDN